MVRLNRIYTKSGDDGDTALGDGKRLPKFHPRVAAYGTVDELSSVIGLARTQVTAEREAGWLARIQNDLFDVGSDLCMPGPEGDQQRIGAVYTERLEGWIDELNEGLEPLKSFVLPGGSLGSAWLHLARTTCRRAERQVAELAALHEESDRVNSEVLRYLNRLSDLFFVMARDANDHGRNDVLWKPGEGSLG